MQTLTRCPTCGSRKIRRVRRDLTEEWRGQRYTVPDVQIEECPDCGEQLFDHEAMQKIEAVCPAYRKKGVCRSAARKRVARGRTKGHTLARHAALQGRLGEVKARLAKLGALARLAKLRGHAKPADLHTSAAREV